MQCNFKAPNLQATASHPRNWWLTDKLCCILTVFGCIVSRCSEYAIWYFPVCRWLMYRFTMLRCPTRLGEVISWLFMYWWNIYLFHWYIKAYDMKRVPFPDVPMSTLVWTVMSYSFIYWWTVYFEENTPAVGVAHIC